MATVDAQPCAPLEMVTSFRKLSLALDAKLVEHKVRDAKCDDGSRKNVFEYDSDWT
jgi:hypothetical protein